MRNYQKELDKLIESIPEGQVPTLLLHACCAPCSSYCLEYLSNYFRITLYYYNPNIYPESEYSLRTDEATDAVYDLITKNADVVKGIFAGHWHSQFYGDTFASYEKDGEIINTTIPQYVISGNVYFPSGIVNRITVK